MSYQYECPKCGKDHGREYSMVCFPSSQLCDGCEGEQIAISSFTTQELVDELRMRKKDVSVIENPIHCKATIQKGNGKYSEVSFGEATILVVTK
jgi:hypothetical protein